MEDLTDMAAVRAVNTSSCPERATENDSADRRRANSMALEKELVWFGTVLDTRINLYFGQECRYRRIEDIPPPDLRHDRSEYARVVNEYRFGFQERLVFILALIPHIRPQLLDTLFIQNTHLDRGFTEFGGWKGKTHGGFLPTCETASFLLAGSDLNKRFDIVRLFQDDHAFARQDILRVEHPGPGEPFFSGALMISPDALSRLTTGISRKPDYSLRFPAKLVTTTLQWDDLVLAPEVLDELHNMLTWLTRSHVLLHEWGLARSIRPGYRSLFYGPPGTGKTLTATLIGATAGVDVYRIDLSMVVSKYVGETEKNLAQIFDQAERKNWILFFDEADALFGKRTHTLTAHDRFANQEVSYLLQRIEDFSGVAILATNLKDNIDEAFARRFHSVIYFPMPDAEQRRRLWEGILNGRCRVERDVSMSRLAETYELSGGAITNVVRHAALRTLRMKRSTISLEDLEYGIVKELRKEGRTL